EIEKACSLLHTHKSLFIRESIRVRLKAMASGESNLGPSQTKDVENTKGRFKDLLPMVVSGVGSLGAPSPRPSRLSHEGLTGQSVDLDKTARNLFHLATVGPVII